MYLPKADTDTANTGAPRRSRDEPRGRGETVLVVEDDADVLNLVDILLTNLDYRVLKAADAQKAIAALEEHGPPDLLLTDVILPGGMTGVELAARIEAEGKKVPVVYMSGYTENTIIHQGVLKEGVLLLSKPFKKYDLAAILRKALREAEREV